MGERAGFVQALLAGVLLWITWSAIDRSDRQIEIAQEQILITKQQLREGENPSVVINLLEYPLDDGDEMHLEIINLSKYPIHIASLYLSTSSYPYKPSLRLPQKRSLASVESSHILLFDKQGLRDFDNMPSNISPDETEFHIFYDKVELSYYYGYHSNLKFTQSYIVRGKHVYAGKGGGRNWRMELVQEIFGYYLPNGDLRKIVHSSSSRL